MNVGNGYVMGVLDKFAQCKYISSVMSPKFSRLLYSKKNNFNFITFAISAYQRQKPSTAGERADDKNNRPRSVFYVTTNRTINTVRCFLLVQNIV